MQATQTIEKPLTQIKSTADLNREVDASGSWTVAKVEALFALPFSELMFKAQETHRSYFPHGDVELATLLSIKTGGCPEDCSYCPQAARYETEVTASKLLDLDEVLEAARAAKAAGSNRFCMGAAWREPKDRDIEKVAAMIKGVKALGLETCATLGMLEANQALALQEAGLDFYNHNLDTSEDFYRSVISTRGYQDRLDTISNVRAAGMSVCCGGIVGMGESRSQRAAFIARLANLSPYPESVPINHLVPVAGTPMADQEPLDPLEFVRTIAVARITMPRARVRLSAGRQELGRAVQAMCFQAGANSIFYGEQLLTTGNPEAEQDRALLAELGLKTKNSAKAEVLI
ncbi:biotin synthase BioB [Polynucleobacter antarcticus]|uniref:Biotin synthase n=1 Tax=Polynucleobacter antarcticus TaxID=1743162 RepID=A0A6M9PQK6_9BURK|nr:biotin synthase BioB [Polynucleobacter antarcticus]QKM61748.1 biotin synthase BioB [Polynucleobacter antarcticus]